MCLTYCEEVWLGLWWRVQQKNFAGHFAPNAKRPHCPARTQAKDPGLSRAKWEVLLGNEGEVSLSCVRLPCQCAGLSRACVATLLHPELYASNYSIAQLRPGTGR